MSEHTPGPWKCTQSKQAPPGTEFDHLIHTEDLRHIAEVFQYQNHDSVVSPAETKANARLIAAAPELLELCKESVRLFRTYGLLAEDPACGPWINSLREVISAATGESP